MDFKQLEAFAAVVEKNSFSEAAKALFLTQPTISAHIRALEEELGTSLVIRTTKNVAITKEGYKLYDYASNMLRLRKKAEDEFKSDDDNIIYLGASTIPSGYLLPEVMKRYQERNREAGFSVYSADSAEVIAQIIDGSVDIGIVGMVNGAPQIEFRALARDRMVVCAPANDYYRNLKKKKVSLDKLLTEPFIMRRQGNGSKKELHYLLEKLGIAEASLNVVAYMNEIEAIRSCIVKGMGISLMSYLSVKEAAQRGEVLLFESDELSGGRRFFIATRKDKILPKAEQNFIDFLNNLEFDE